MFICKFVLIVCDYMEYKGILYILDIVWIKVWDVINFIRIDKFSFVSFNYFSF